MRCPAPLAVPLLRPWKPLQGAQAPWPTRVTASEAAWTQRREHPQPRRGLADTHLSWRQGRGPCPRPASAPRCWGLSWSWQRGQCPRKPTPEKEEGRHLRLACGFRVKHEAHPSRQSPQQGLPVHRGGPREMPWLPQREPQATPSCLPHISTSRWDSSWLATT